MGSGPPTPVEAKASSVPADDGRRFHDDENLGPTGPKAAQRGLEESVEAIQRRSRAFPLENCDLLPKGENLESGVAATA